MSGFCALVDLAGAPVDPEALRAMAAFRRGPDGETHWIGRLGDSAGLCHLPLHATAESVAERQPLSSRDGTLHVVADVRLDNRRELIDRLTADGTLLERQPGDAELILAAYLRWGRECPAHLLGDFAFVLWDARLRRLFCACDAVGVKPLHYARAGSLLCVASDARQVLQHPAVSRRLDEIAVGDYLASRATEPCRTFFRNVRRLSPGHRLVAESTGVHIDRFWELDPDARTVHPRDQDYVDHFLALFRRAVSDRLRTQAGSIGILMSGGLDSTSVAAVASRCAPAEGSRRLFSASFVFERLQQCDERQLIQAVTAHLDLEAELISAERFPVLDDPETRRPSLEAPFMAWDACFREALRRARGRGARVLLTGHGGDDLLWGSRLVYADRLRRGDPRAVLEVLQAASAHRQAWSWIVYHHLVQPLLSPAGDRALRRLTGKDQGSNLPDWIDAGFARRTGLTDRMQETPPRRFPEAARQALYDHLRQTPWDRSAFWYDQHAADFGIEVRHPFLDRRLIEFLVSIPPAQLFRADLSKRLLRQAMIGFLPETVRLRRAKTHLSAFLAFSLDGGLGGGKRMQIERLLAAPLATEMGILDGKRLLAAYKRNPDRLWNPIALEIWLRELDSSSRPAMILPAA